MTPAYREREREPLSEIALELIQSARDKLAAELREMDASVAPPIPEKKIEALRAKLETLDEILSDHGVTRH